LFEGIIEDLGERNETDEPWIGYKSEGGRGYFCLYIF